MLIILEALKIEKIQRPWRVRVWFLLLFGIAALAYITMPRNDHGILYQEQLQQFLLRQGAFPLPPAGWLAMLIREISLTAVGMFFLLLYAVNWIYSPLSESDANRIIGHESLQMPIYSLDTGKTTTGIALRYYPRFLLLAISSIAVYLFSIPLMNIPFYIFLSMFSMTIFIIIFDRKSIPDAMEASYKMTRGLKFFIFISFMVLRAVTSIVGDLLQLAFASSLWAASLIRAFFFALKTLAYGRLAALLYRAFSIEGFRIDGNRL